MDYFPRSADEESAQTSDLHAFPANVSSPDGAGGSVRLKTDSPFLYTYTRELVHLNDLPVYADIPDLYAPGADIPANMTDIMDIRTHYERQWLDRGLTIKYLHFGLPEEADAPLVEYTGDIPKTHTAATAADRCSARTFVRRRP